MTRLRPTYREVDGRRIEGTWRPIFIKNGGTHYLADLKIYADGQIDCWGMVDREGFGEKLRSGWVATSLLAVPEPHRVFVLGDMDHRDIPIRVLSSLPGQLPAGGTVDDPGELVTEADREAAFAYLEDREVARLDWAAGSHDDGPIDGDPGSVRVDQIWYRRGWPDEPGIHVLRNEWPAPLELATGAYATVAHAYWARSALDAADHDRIRDEPEAGAARKLALSVDRVPGWSARRLAVMTELLTAKAEQHPTVARQLADTGEKSIIYQEALDPFWGVDGDGRNWMGRLLELVRAIDLVGR